MRIATWNVQHGRRPDGVVDLGALIDGCRALDADVLALQEVDRSVGRSGHADQAAAIADATGMEAVFGASLSFPPGGGYGNALLVRGRIGAWSLRRLPRMPGSEPRTALVARVRTTDGTPLAVVATHLAVRTLEARIQLARLLDRAAAPALHRGERLVVLGDLNLGPRHVEPAAARRGLARVPVPPTFPASAPSRQIDHILLPEPMVATSIDARALGVSDHLAVIVGLGAGMAAAVEN